jgi:PPK2 family polyphosphate:nucleotide phosphotransferase
MSDQAITLPPGSTFSLRELDPDWTGAFHDKDEARDQTQDNLERLKELQEKLYAQNQHALLIVLQGMDTAGKDGTIEHVMGAFNPQGVHVTSFKVPTEEEYAHDFLWRVHKVAPRRRMVGIFNRSHYEDVLAARVLEIVPEAIWRNRYQQINEFERLLSEAGVTIVKFLLHIGKAEQAERLRDRQRKPSKQWKFSPGDLEQRKLWDQYCSAYEDALTFCNTEHAPWYVIPANRKWCRNLVVSDVLIKTMVNMDLRYPDPIPDIQSYDIPE